MAVFISILFIDGGGLFKADFFYSFLFEFGALFLGFDMIN